MCITGDIRSVQGDITGGFLTACEAEDGGTQI